MISVFEIALLILSRLFKMSGNLESGLVIRFLTPNEQEMGVPQGYILSVTIFIVKINNIVQSICPGVECFLYEDDFCICYRSKHMHTIERQLRQVLNNLNKWFNENGFKFSKIKTVNMHFCNSRKFIMTQS